MVVRVTRPWSGKKEPSNPDKKQQHLERKTKKTILHHIEDQDWEEQLKDYKNHATEPL